MITFKFRPPFSDAPLNILALAELHFQTEPLLGLRLDGFLIRVIDNEIEVGFPRSWYKHNDVRESWPLLAPVDRTNSRDLATVGWLEAAVLEQFDRYREEHGDELRAAYATRIRLVREREQQLAKERTPQKATPKKPAPVPPPPARPVARKTLRGHHQKVGLQRDKGLP